MDPRDDNGRTEEVSKENVQRHCKSRNHDQQNCESVQPNRGRHGETMGSKSSFSSKLEASNEQSNNNRNLEEKSDVGRQRSLSQEACHVPTYYG